MSNTALITGASSGIGAEFARYYAQKRGELVVFNEASLGFMLGWVVPFLPRRIVLKMVDRMQAK